MRILSLFILLIFSCHGQVIVPEIDRVDCLPGRNSTQSECDRIGCMWDKNTAAPAPPCYIPPEGYGYKSNGDVVRQNHGFYRDLERMTGPSMFGGDFQHIRIEFQFQTLTRLRVKISPLGETRFQVPIYIEGEGVTADEARYEVMESLEPVYSFKIVRKDTGIVIFDSSLGGLTVADQFLQIAAKLPSSNVYGFGEQEQPSFRHDMNFKTWGMYARDHAPEGDANLYGVHPRYTVVEKDGNTHGVLILNSNPQDVTLTPAPGLVYRTIGGILDLYFFLGPEPEAVVSQYTEAVGRYYVPPYWALGFHLCRWGYNTLENMAAAWKRTIDAKIPFDAQWADIDIMDRRLDFTVDSVGFAGVTEFIDELHAMGMKFVTILDPAISTGEPAGKYPPFDEGNQLDIWVKNSSGQPLTGKVWPDDPTYFPDFFNPVTQDWWVRHIRDWHKMLAWDGIWIDMNEPANFVTGSTEGCPDNKWNNPPYTPYIDGNLQEKTICLDSEQYLGKHYDLHSMYGWSETQPTLRGVQEATGKRGIALSRSTFIGSGRWTAHWLGDNWSEWDNLHFSIIGTMQFNQFGIPLVGADICGFIGNATEEMCARWQQLGAFYPFSRNHNLLESIDQDPGVWEGGLVARVARRALETKYTWLPFLYSLFYEHTLKGGTVVRPIWHEFPRDSIALGIDDQFMWGPALLISPIILQGQTSRQVYLPPDSIWYNIYTMESVEGGNINVTSDLANEDDDVPLHVRGGYILPGQEPGMNTAESMRLGKYRLLVALDSNEEAVGNLYLDDGDSINPEHFHTKINFEAGPGVLTSWLESTSYPSSGQVIASIAIMGVRADVTQVMLNNEMSIPFTFNSNTGLLQVETGTIPLMESFTLHWV